jgi:hypothetical protein
MARPRDSSWKFEGGDCTSRAPSTRNSFVAMDHAELVNGLHDAHKLYDELKGFFDVEVYARHPLFQRFP